MRHAIIRNNDRIIYWCIYASLGIEALIQEFITPSGDIEGHDVERLCLHVLMGDLS